LIRVVREKGLEEGDVDGGFYGEKMRV